MKTFDNKKIFTIIGLILLIILIIGIGIVVWFELFYNSPKDVKEDEEIVKIIEPVITRSDDVYFENKKLVAITFDDGPSQNITTRLLDELDKVIKEYDITKLILGYPKNMNNTIGEKCELVLRFKEMLENKFNLPVILQDERLTTVEATNYMIAADISIKKRKKKVDALAANIILQTYLDKERGGKI